MFNSVGSQVAGSSPAAAAVAAAVSLPLTHCTAPLTPAEHVFAELQQTHKIEELIGRGATGDVYKVKNLVLDRFEALKLISAQVSDQGLIRIQGEARALSKVVHQSIVAVHNVAVTADGTPYILMEYVDGVPLSRIIEQQTPLNPDWVTFVFAQMCFAMYKAHEAGIVHRDLKPDNVIIARGPDGYDAVKIIDFGIARDLVNEQNLNTKGVFVGTPLYMSPEQFDGECVDSRSDIYSLGCVLFEMLTGAPPFDGLTTLGLAYQHAYCQPILPGHLRRFQPIIDKAMAKNPGDRYQTGEAMWDDLYSYSLWSFWHRPELLIPADRVSAFAKVRAGSIGLAPHVVVFWSLLAIMIWFVALSFVSHCNPIFVTLAALVSFVWVGHMAWVRKLYPA